MARDGVVTRQRGEPGVDGGDGSGRPVHNPARKTVTDGGIGQ